jgi:Ca-activated chloride channel family protein
MKFAEPTWLIAGLFVIAGMVFVYRLLDVRQRAALAEFASSHLLAKLTASFSPARRMLKRGLFLAALACIFVALARPQWGFHWVDQKERGIDLFFAIDTSKSMLTQDVNPDRLTRAKMAITDFVRKLDGDRVGLIAFAGESFLQAPMTLDYDAFQDTLDSIDANTIPRGGTDIASAIHEAQAAFAQAGDNKKILILITDGEDLQGQGIDAARAAAKDGMVIYTVGVGTGAGGLIPVPNGNGGTDFVKDDTGQFVKSHLDESTLSQIAQVTGGMYQPLGQEGQGLGVIYDKAIASMPKHDLAARRERVYEERYQLPLAAGLVLLLASMLIGTRRRTSAQAKPIAPVRVTKRAAFALLAVLTIPVVAQASPQSAESAYKKGEYDKAESQYQDAAAQHPDVAPLQYDLGAAAYKSGEFDTALPAFQKALSTDDPALQQQSYYNIGNTQYRIGQKTEKKSPQETIKQWQQAVQAYDGALKLKPDDGDAKFNRDFVQKKLDELEKQQKQQQQQDQKNQQNKQDKDQQQQNQQDQNQQQQNKDQQDKNQQNQQQGQNQQQNQDQQQQNQQQSGSKGGQDSQQDQQQQSNGQNQAQNGQQNQKGQQQPQPQTADNKQGQDKSQNGQQQQQQQTAGNQKQDQDKGQNGQQQQQTAGNQPQNQQPNGNGGDQQKEQMAQGNDKGGKGRQSGEAAAGDKDKQSGDPTAEAALPAGELTKEQAKDLLNSLKGEEHILPVAADTRSAKPQDPTVLKDW